MIIYKALSHKYLFKIPTGKVSKKGNPIYRYIYKYTGKARTDTHRSATDKTYTDVNPTIHSNLFRNGIKVGTAFRDAAQGEAHGGHWIVESIDDSRGWRQRYELRHDETGQVLLLSDVGLEAMALRTHGEKIDAEAARRDLRRTLQVREAFDVYRSRWPSLPKDTPEAIESRKHRARLKSLMLLAQKAGKFDYLEAVGATPVDPLTLGAKPLAKWLNDTRSALAGVFATNKQTPADLVDAGEFELATKVASYWHAVDKIQLYCSNLYSGDREALAKGKAKGKMSNVRLIHANFTPQLDRKPITPTNKKIKQLFDAYKALAAADKADAPARVAEFIDAINAAYPDKDQTRIFVADFHSYVNVEGSRMAYRALLSQGVLPVNTNPLATPTSPFFLHAQAEITQNQTYLVTDTPNALAIDADELTAQILAGYTPNAIEVAGVRQLLATGFPNVLVRSNEGDYHIPAKDVVPRLQSKVRQKLEKRAERHRNEVAPRMALIQDEIKSGLIRDLSQQLRAQSADKLQAHLVGTGFISQEAFDKAKKISVEKDVSLTDAIFDVEQKFIILSKLPENLKDQASDTGHMVRLARAMVEYFFKKWGVPDTTNNPGRISNFETLPDWSDVVVPGALPSHRADDFAHMIHPDLMPIIKTLHVKQIDPANPWAIVRAFATDNVALVDQFSDHGTFWHEAAHTVEMGSRELGSRVKDFFMHRIEKSKRYEYKSITEDHPNEKGYHDDFIDAYTGRWYYQDGLGEETNTHASEILSMGGSYLGRSIKEFAARDPEHLAFVLLALGGQLGLRDHDADAKAPAKIQQRIQQGTYDLASLRQRHKSKGAG